MNPKVDSKQCFVSYISVFINYKYRNNTIQYNIEL